MGEEKKIDQIVPLKNPPAVRSNTLGYAYCWLFYGLIVGMFGWCLFGLFVNPSVLSLAAIVGMVALFGGSVPAALEDLGWYLANVRRQYHLAEGILLVAHKLYITFSFVPACASMGALRLAQVALLRSDLVSAEVWATKCLAMAPRDLNWCSQLYALSVMAEVQFIEHRYGEAELALQQAFEIHRTGKEVHLVPLRNKIDEFHAGNLDLLARICLQRGDLVHAQNYIDQSVAVRRVVPALAVSADAYNQYASGSLLLIEHPAEASQHFRAALLALPARLKTTQECALAIDIARRVIQCSEEGNEEWAKAHDLLAKTAAGGLHPNLLEIAANAHKG
jgi:tetratricopeptide (TPR) repeat protein